MNLELTASTPLLLHEIRSPRLLKTATSWYIAKHHSGDNTPSSSPSEDNIEYIYVRGILDLIAVNTDVRTWDYDWYECKQIFPYDLSWVLEM